MNQDVLSIIASVSRNAAELEQRIERRAGLLTGTPYIIECSPGLYLVADGEGYRAGSITGRVVCYTPESIDDAVHQVRISSAGIFSSARKINHHHALELELAAARNIIATLSHPEFTI